MNKWILTAVLVGALATFASADTILLVSDSGPDAGQHDANYVTWLQGLGYTVDTGGMSGQYQGDLTQAEVDAANAADLVIVSRITNSGAYNKPLDWNTKITSPLLLMSGYLTRDSRWKWHEGGNQDANKVKTDIIIETGQETHPWLAGVDLGPDGNTVVAFDWSPGTEAPKGVNLQAAGVNWPAAATIVGTFDDREMLLDIPAGTTLFGGAGDTAGRRAFLAHWGYDGKVDGNAVQFFDDYITDDYETLLSNMIGDMIPEPATMAILALGGSLALLRRRRR